MWHCEREVVFELKKIIILCTLLVLVGCGGRWVEMTRQEIKPPSPEPELSHYEKIYKVGEKKTVFIGQEIVKVTEYQPLATGSLYSKTPESLSVKFAYKWYNYEIKSEKNEEIRIIEVISLDNKTLYLGRFLDNNKGEWGIAIDENGEVFKQGIYSYAYNMIYYPEAMDISPSHFKFYLHKKNVLKGENKKITYELLYSGNNNVALNLTYRDFTGDDLARPAFYQVLTYEGSAKQIRFKDFVIKVDSADNEKITYTVLADGLK